MMYFLGLVSIVSAVYVVLLLAFRAFLGDLDYKGDLAKRHAMTVFACIWLSMDPNNYLFVRYAMEAIAVGNTISAYYMIVKGTKYTPVSLKDKVAVVTGANSGIGFEVAKQLAGMGAHVVFACRSQERADAAMAAVTKATGSTKLQFIQLDLGNFRSIRQFADDFKKTKLPLDILVNNAGINFYKRETTAEGHESVFGINHLGPFLLTNVLLGHLIRAKGPRIVNIGSCMMKFSSSIPFDDLMSKKNYADGMMTYCWTKWANYLFTLELHRRYADKNIKVVCVHPGLAISNMQNNMHPVFGFLAKMFNAIRWIVQSTSEQGAYTPVFAAIDPSIQGGEYLERCEVVQPESKLTNDKTAKKLWDVSCMLTGWKK
ncbi:Aste57867_15707 [Aphanomyces stellatus]|uniref:Aste57867_15707 protein n=1 Tax=Aphanomyces stellatus TaxID=120398 RepID=A0A485L525_9STRA|nr:hypothetical protein As57867_015651 [Aphanomyces stellatus]VFT92498.1 Aste57867_15707 [Aphanomyces stellatus]